MWDLTPVGFTEPLACTRQNPQPYAWVWVCTGVGMGCPGKPQGFLWHSLFRTISTMAKQRMRLLKCTKWNPYSIGHISRDVKSLFTYVSNRNHSTYQQGVKLGSSSSFPTTFNKITIPSEFQAWMMAHFQHQPRPQQTIQWLFLSPFSNKIGSVIKK